MGVEETAIRPSLQEGKRRRRRAPRVEPRSVGLISQRRRRVPQVPAPAEILEQLRPYRLRGPLALRAAPIAHLQTRSSPQTSRIPDVDSEGDIAMNVSQVAKASDQEITGIASGEFFKLTDRRDVPDVSEGFSRGCFTSRAREFGMVPGFMLDYGIGGAWRTRS